MADVRVVMADDHALFTETVAAQLEGSGVEIVARCGDAEAALVACSEQHPTVAILDIDMPGRSAFEVADRLRRMRPPVAVLFLSAHVHDTWISRALDVGARGYLTKRASARELKDAVLEIARGGSVFSAEIQERIVIEVGGPKLPSSTRVTRMDTLTAREVEVLQLVAAGMTARQIAATLHIAVKTVDKHTQSLMRKLAVHNRVELTRFAIREGLVVA